MPAAAHIKKGKIMTTIRIDVQNGTVTCGTKGGHVRAPYGTKITWTSKGTDRLFELEFLQLGLETADAAQKLVHWPFEEPMDSKSGPTDFFVGTLKEVAAGDAPIYKYNVRVGDLLLDPILIIDRK
jgi:hypothetical protein